ncbi:MAG: sulfatase-like hydrolase/transferase [Acidimicrobiia bacterium]|nr:sulfatase-like hydrolase/transferase [Acidimicrobiia bacterium]MDH5237560.1 sulfatase-like hydrolase/transferase [Acidimicrobiia bacterium]
MTNPPNILFLLTDQQRADHVGYIPGSPARTPVLDQLARQGTVFTDTYSAATNCAPSRGSLLTGLPPQSYPGHEGGLEGTGRSLKPGFWTIGHALRTNGYQTGYTGKGHFRPIHADHGFTVMRMAEHIRSYERDNDPNPMDDWLRWLVWQGRADASASHLFGPNPDAGREYLQNWTAMPFGYEAQFHPTTWVTDEAISFLERRAPDQPYFLVVSYPHPHPPLDPPEPYDTLFDPAEVELPPPYQPAPGGILDWWADQLGRVGRQTPGHEDLARRAIAYYRGLITQIDDNVGRLLEHVDLTDTVVCFTSDHGDYAGHKNRMFKNPLIPFEDLARVPMFWAGAGIEPGVCREPVQSSDFAPTVLDLTGIERPRFTEHLVSLAPVLDGQPADPDRIVHTFDRTGVNVAARQRSLKYIRAAISGGEVLFDLQHDPDETASVLDDPAHAAALAEFRSSVDRYEDTAIPDLPYFDT